MYRDLLSYIEHELANTLNSVTLPLEPLKGRVSRQVKHMPIPASNSSWDADRRLTAGGAAA